MSSAKATFAKPEMQNMIELHQKFHKDIYSEIFHLMGELESEIKSLEQYFQEVFANRQLIGDFRDVVELGNILEKTRNQMKRQSYYLLYGSDETRYLYGEISEDEVDKILALRVSAYLTK